MGGGDLNMKKHFHPLTMENLERVWKAEEKKRIEDERIQQLQQELEAERQKESFEQQAIVAGIKKKKGEKLDWMYQGQQTVDTEAYLLGKKIDKNVDVGKEEEKGLSSGRISVPKTSLPKANDVLAKIKEDPLFLIKKKEEENKKNLLANPIKLRKMKALIEEQTSSMKHERRHKRSKKKHQSTSSSEESSDEEERKAKRRREKRHESHSPQPSCSHQTKGKYKERLGNGVPGEYNTKTNRKSSHDQSNYESKYTQENDRYHRRDTENDSYHRRDRENDRYHCRDTERKEVKQRFYNDRTKSRHHSSSSSDEDEKLEAQRKTMMSNAKWRQEQRSTNTKKYQREKEAEEKYVKAMLKKSGATEEKAHFVQKMQKESLSSTDASVEDRIRRNIHSKQRTNAALNKKFTSR